MKQLRPYTLCGIFFVLLTGSLSHFLYEWTGNNFIVGLFAPVSESVWEHMKLIFFPMLLYALIVVPRLKRAFPDAGPALMSGALTGAASIPVIFYTYTGILGRHLFLLDLMTFVSGVVLAFCSAHRSALSGMARKRALLAYLLTIIFTLLFWLFTVCPPDLGLFAEPGPGQ